MISIKLTIISIWKVFVLKLTIILTFFFSKQVWIFLDHLKATCSETIKLHQFIHFPDENIRISHFLYDSTML